MLNRRSSKTINGTTIAYVYDGAQAIAEVTNGSISANLLTGLMIDEALARYTQAGARTYITDALGSVIAQASDTQAIDNYYAYTPYGETTALGPDGGNASQYTARENDGTGLYYYRARYYDPVLKRFIAEDPIGLAGGLNGYSYADGNPVSNTDPSGTIVPVAGIYARCVAQCMAMAAVTAALPGGGGLDCFNIGDAAGECLLECLDPRNWGGGGKGGMGATAKGKGGKGGGTSAQGKPPKNATGTLDHVQKNGGQPPPGQKGGGTFQNDGRGGGDVLPKTDSTGKAITYKEYDVKPYQQGVNRGPERIVVGSDGAAYYTNNHYGTFTKIP